MANCLKKDEAYSQRLKEKALGKECKLKEPTLYVSPSRKCRINFGTGLRLANVYLL